MDEIIAANPKQVEQVQTKPKTLGGFVGQLMRTRQGEPHHRQRASPGAQMAEGARPDALQGASRFEDQFAELDRIVETPLDPAFLERLPLLDQIQVKENRTVIVQSSISPNWYVMDALAPFTRGEVQAGGRIVLSILGDDAWKPHALFIFGLDTASGRPNEVVSLVSLPVWGTRQMSTDPAEGDASVDLQVTPG